MKYINFFNQANFPERTEPIDDTSADLILSAQDQYELADMFAELELEMPKNAFSISDSNILQCIKGRQFITSFFHDGLAIAHIFRLDNGIFEALLSNGELRHNARIGKLAKELLKANAK